ncbi:hypothetical protein X926_07730 [Petrotoga sp. HWHPT.55.6.3]|nr:hypothetical protein X926_07730 [Petrotoga sp. HWHPT.55.6.3]
MIEMVQYNYIDFCILTSTRVKVAVYFLKSAEVEKCIKTF